MNYQPAPAANPSTPKPGPQHSPDSDRHSRKCIICAHPDRDTIERCFLHWHCPQNIAGEFGVPLASIYRHAHSTGLFGRRSGNLRHSLEFIIERAERSLPSADAIVRAVRAYAHINDDGRWVDPPKQVLITNRYEQLPAPPSAPPPADTDDAAMPGESSQWARREAPAPGQDGEFLIVNGKIRNSAQPAQNTPHSQILIVNKPAASSLPNNHKNPPQTWPSAPAGASSK